MSFKIIPRYENHLWYPILVKIPGFDRQRIIEMRGSEVNKWNDMVRDMVREQWEADAKNHPRGWCI